MNHQKRKVDAYKVLASWSSLNKRQNEIVWKKEQNKLAQLQNSADQLKQYIAEVDKESESLKRRSAYCSYISAMTDRTLSALTEKQRSKEQTLNRVLREVEARKASFESSYRINKKAEEKLMQAKQLIESKNKKYEYIDAFTAYSMGKR